VTIHLVARDAKQCTHNPHQTESFALNTR
jgi:hypothetical protein